MRAFMLAAGLGLALATSVADAGTVRIVNQSGSTVFVLQARVSNYANWTYDLWGENFWLLPGASVDQELNNAYCFFDLLATASEAEYWQRNGVNLCEGLFTWTLVD